MKVYVTSDPHFWHARVIDYCNRPWATVESMNAGLIERWNNTVKRDDDLVYVLGDGAMNGKKAIACFEQLRGRKRLIRGNHDHDLVKKGSHLFEWVRDYAEIRVEGEYDTSNCTPAEERALSNRLVLMHFPIEVWNNKHCGAVHLHGHSHGSTRRERLIRGRVDVGVDCWNWHPVTLKEAITRALSYGNVVEDHHGAG